MKNKKNNEPFGLHKDIILYVFLCVKKRISLVCEM